jgi:hypothetical protein
MVGVSITEHGIEWDPLVDVEVHPAAELFPLLHGVEFNLFIEDIRENGLREPIVFTPDGRLLDGRNRYRACKTITDVEPARRTERSEPWSYVISTNVHRRHLSESQRAMIAARIAERRNGQRRGNQYSKDQVEALPAGKASTEGTPTNQQAQDMLNISQGSISRAKRVIKHGTSALRQAVEAGKVSVTTADRVSREMNTEEQNTFVNKINSGAQPRGITPPDKAREKRRLESSPDNSRSPTRHRFVNISALRHLQDSFDVVDVVLKSASEGLDPSITSEQAAQWLDNLFKAHGAYHRIVALLKQRKEENTSDHQTS